MNKYYHRGNGEVVLPERTRPSLNYERDFINHLPVYAHCSPDLPVGWFEGEEVYQEKREVWKATTKSYYDTEFEDSRRIWIDPVAEQGNYEQEAQELYPSNILDSTNYQRRKSHIKARQMSEQEIRELREEVRKLRVFVKDCYISWDCDEDAHRYNTKCRKCEAAKYFGNKN